MYALLYGTTNFTQLACRALPFVLSRLVHGNGYSCEVFSFSGYVAFVLSTKSVYKRGKPLYKKGDIQGDCSSAQGLCRPAY